MPVPIIAWGVLGVAGLAGAGWAARETGEALDSATRLARWVVVGGALYVSYEALKSSGALK
ncbi:MAG: hypothetical protein CSA72_08340 [Rhodobacterales bacterium]|nr:MAG: hypothetical protein CSA72_08340 [Rhodobacterales bacterium]